MVVIGGIIGAGIFISPYIVAQRLDTPLLVLAAWTSGGAIALAGAFSYAELGALFPQAGGQYVYLRDGLHPLAGFLYGWALLLVIESRARSARDCGTRAAVRDQLPGRQAGQPRAERARCPQSRSARNPDRRGGTRRGASGLAARGIGCDTWSSVHD